MLARIVATKREEVARLRLRARELASAAGARAEPPRPFADALVRDDVALIAEVKRRSPGAGAIRPDLDPVELACGYRRGGAAALSVLTDASYFGGSLEDLAQVRAAGPLPVLRKDFTIDELQVHEARAAGADAILLIVRILDDGRLRGLRELAESYGMAALVEVHDVPELERALESGARVLGINNRDLATFRTDVAVTLELLPRVPRDVLVVSESGIRSAEEVARLGDAGVHAVLVGETLLRDEDPGAAAGRLSGQPRAGRRPAGAEALLG